MTQEKTGPDATPRIGLDLGRQIFDDPTGSDHQEERTTGASEERIRQRAHEIWESEGCSGDPEDHWYRAKRELLAQEPERSDATGEDAAPGAAVEVNSAATGEIPDKRILD